jgi:hypothetical protein
MHLVQNFFSLNFNHLSAITGGVCFTLIYLLRRWRPRWPDGLIVLLLASAVAALAQLDQQGVRLVRDLGEISGAMPIFVGFPLNEEGLRLVPRVTGTAIAIALLGMLEAVAIAAASAEQHIIEVATLVATDRRRVLQSAKAGPASYRLFEKLPMMPRFTIERVRKQLDTSFPTATAAVKVLEDLGIVAEMTGQKKNRSYSYQAYVELLSR